MPNCANIFRHKDTKTFTGRIILIVTAEQQGAKFLRKLESHARHLANYNILALRGVEKTYTCASKWGKRQRLFTYRRTVTSWKQKHL